MRHQEEASGMGTVARAEVGGKEKKEKRKTKDNNSKYKEITL